MSHKGRRKGVNPKDLKMVDVALDEVTELVATERTRHSGPRVKARYQANLNLYRPLLPFLTPTDQDVATQMMIDVQDMMDRYEATYLIPKAMKNKSMAQILLDYPEAKVVGPEVILPILDRHWPLLMVCTQPKKKA